MSDKITGETKEEYSEDVQNYFRNVQDAKRPGLSADQMAIADKHLPSKEQEQRHLDYMEKGLTKTSRSGAFTDKPNASPAIFPNGLKFASDFIEAHTPGKYQPQAPMKPPDRQVGKLDHIPKPAAVVDICIDCMKQVDPAAYIGGLAPVDVDDSQRCAAMGVQYGELVIYCICVKCNDAAMSLAKSRKHELVLVFGGTLKDPRDVMLAAKYGFPINLHDGNEKTLQQFAMIRRQERIMENLWDYLKQEHEKGDSPVFRKNKKVAE